MDGASPRRLHIALFMLGGALLGRPVQCEAPDVTSRLASVGAPMGDRWKKAGDKHLYARNVWDLQAFDGRLYAAYGDFSLNSGHIELTCYDPKKEMFVSEMKTEDQCVLRYRPFGDRLVCAGNDPDGETCFLYIRDAGGWRKVATPPAKHAFDAYIAGPRTFVSIQDGGGKVAESADGGRTWPAVHGPLDPVRTFSFFELGDELHLSTYDGTVYRHTGKGFSRASGFQLGRPNLPAGLRPWGAYNVAHHPVNLSPDRVFFIGWNIHIDMQARLSHYNGYGLFAAVSAGGKAACQPVPLRGLPEDVIVSDRAVYAVANDKGVPNDAKPYLIRIYAGRSGAFAEIARFRSDAIARSLEILDGDMYVGLGCTREDLSTSAGEILKIDRSLLKKPGG